MDLQDNKRKWKNRTLTASLEFALTGIMTAIKEERNMHKHAVTALLVVIAGLIFGVSATEWLFLFLSIFLVIAFEIMNSAIENVVDLASDYHFSMLAKNAKDMAAGAVLVISVFALLVGMIIFLPKIWQLIF
ncbi:diacylglycerol kinase [Streptococcus himalayensis]|uniref:Diacylglycerol kinase n=1 Tax=Streptococcus himalayensis TaxID=1888195 RepID=A0A917A613_9STRE|nr:diacylglycerol kinase [Streptococcus himalayensis]GGE27576.1 diacylglycerol kinase [Streptococcus himalayensis]